MKVASLEIELLANIARLQGDMNKAQGAVKKSMDNIERNVQRVQKAFATLGLGVGFGALISQATKMADSWQGLENRLRLVTKGQKELATATNSVFAISQRTSQAIDSTAQVYQRFAQNANTLGLSQQKVAALTETVGKAIAISGGSAASSQGALMQFGQALASGVLRGEEFNSVMEGAPGLAQALATGLGVPVGALRALAAEGKITGDVIVDALTKAGDSVDVLFGSRIKTVGQAFTELNNSVTKFVGQLAQSTGASSSFANVIGTLADNVDGIARALLFLAATAIPAAVRALWSLSAAMLAIPGMQLVKLVSVIAGALLAFNGNLTVSTENTRALGGAWDVIADGIISGLKTIDRWMISLGTSIREFFGMVESEPQTATGKMTSAFETAFMAIAGFMDNVYEGFTGNMSALGSVFVTFGNNAVATMRWSADWISHYFTEAIFAIKDSMNALPGVSFDLKVPTSAPQALQLQSFTAAAKTAYNEGKRTLGMVSSLNAAIGGREANSLGAAFEDWWQGETDAATATGKLTDAIDKNTKKLTEAQKAQAAFEKEREKSIESQYAEISSIQEKTQQVRDEIATYGMSKTAIDRLAIARLEEQKAVLMGFAGSEQQVELLNREIEARRELMSATSQKEVLDANKKASEDAAQEWQRTSESIGQSLTDALLRGFESGKSFAENFRDTLKNMFKTLILQPIIQPIMSQVAGGIQNAMGMGQQGSKGGGFSTDMFGGSNGSLAKGVGWLGEKFGSNAVSSFATGMGMTSFSLAGASSAVPSLTGLTAGSGMAASLGSGAAGTVGAGLNTGAMAAGSAAMSYLPYVGALFAASQGQYATAAGTAIGTAILPGIGTAIGAVVGMLADTFIGSSFAGESRSGGSYNWTAERGAVERGKWDSGNPGDEANKAISSILDMAVTTINSTFKGVGSDAALSYFMGWAESSEKGRGGTASGGRLGINGSEVAFGTTRKGQGHGSSSGDLGEMIDNLAVDAYQTIIQAWQAGIAEFPPLIQGMIRGIDADALTMEQAQGVVKQVAGTIDAVNQMRAAFDLLPFENLKSLSFDATASLLAFGGGVETFTASLGSYYANFYSQEEQFAAKSADLATALLSVGVTMPALTGSADQAKAAFRAIVDSFDVTTEAGQRQYATMVGLSGAFAELTGVMEQLNDASTQAADLLEAFTARGDLVPALDVAALKTMAFTDQIALLSLGADRAVIDFTKLEAKLKDIDTDAFVATIALAFESIAQRISTLIGDIASERGSVLSAALGIINPGALTPEAIRRQIAGINTVLPSNAGVVAAGAQMNAADAALAQRKAQENAARNAYLPAQGAYDAAQAQVPGLQAAYDNLQGVITGKEAEIAQPRKYSEGRRYVRELQATMPALYDELGRLGSALNQAKEAASAARWNELVGLSSAYAQAVTASASAQAIANAAALAAKTANTQYADALQNFALDAGKSVTKLADLREQTVKYYQAQKQLADLMSNSASGLRKTVLDYRVSQMEPEQQFAHMQAEYAKAYSLAMSTEGESLVGYADQLNSMLNPMLEKARDAFATDAQYNSFAATMLARAEAIAQRLDINAPAGYEDESLSLLGQIDATLAALDESARSAEALIVNAVNIGRDATVNGLRQITNALTGNAVAAFASGGSHTGGLRLVGEHGPELEVTGPSRIYSANQTRSMLSGGNGGEVAAEIRALREEVAGLRIEARATASNTNKIAKQGDRNEQEGILIRSDTELDVTVFV